MSSSGIDDNGTPSCAAVATLAEGIEHVPTLYKSRVCVDQHKFHSQVHPGTRLLLQFDLTRYFCHPDRIPAFRRSNCLKLSHYIIHNGYGRDLLY